MFNAIADGFNYLFNLIGDFGLWMLGGIQKLLQPIFDFFSAIFYLLYKLGVILVKIIELVIGLVKLLIGLLTGLFKTITGLNYSGAPAAIPEAYQSAFDNLQPIFQMLQLDKVAYLVLVAIWIFTAIYATKIIGGMRGGN